MDHLMGRLKLSRNTKQLITILSVLVILIIAFAMGNPKFLSAYNFIAIIRHVVPIIIVGAAMSFVIISGNIDISVGSIIGFCAVMFSYFLIWGINFYAAIGLILILGTIIGFINAALAVKLQIPSIIATMATMTSIRGLTYIICGAVSVQGALIKPASALYRTVFFKDVFPIPLPLVFLAVVLALFIFLERKTVLGKYTMAIGGNESAAKFAGINVNKIKMMTFLLTGVASAFAAIIITGKTAQGDPNTGLNFEFDVISACILGGINIKGGEGSIVKMIIGAAVLAVLSNGMNMMGIDSFYQGVVKGVVLLIAIALDSLTRKNMKS